LKLSMGERIRFCSCISFSICYLFYNLKNNGGKRRKRKIFSSFIQFLGFLPVFFREE
jgi:hypothetical protein